MRGYYFNNRSYSIVQRWVFGVYLVPQFVQSSCFCVRGPLQSNGSPAFDGDSERCNGRMFDSYNWSVGAEVFRGQKQVPDGGHWEMI